MIKRRSLRTRNIKMLVLDEADEMLSRGFKDQIYEVYRYLPPVQVRACARACVCVCARVYIRPGGHVYCRVSNVLASRWFCSRRRCLSSAWSSRPSL
jgi:hypothetical protein